MDDLTRMHYLQAMGIDAYVARQPLPGAAPSRPQPVISVPARREEPAVPTPQAPRVAPLVRPDARPAARETVARTPAASADPAAPAMPTVVHFSLSAVFCGGIAWVEQLQGYPLAREQVRLIQAMARSLGCAANAPKTAQFDWPIHRNPQLDQGLDAARDGVTAFLQRHLGEQACRALVLLGESCGQYIALDSLSDVQTVRTRATLELLGDWRLKRDAWRDLQALAARG